MDRPSSHSEGSGDQAGLAESHSDYGDAREYGSGLQDRKLDTAALGRVIDHTRASGRAADAGPAGPEQMFRQRFWVCLGLSLPVLLYGETLTGLLHFAMPAFPGSGFLPPLFSTVILIYGGLPFLQMAVPELRERRPGTMALISLALAVAFVYSLIAFVKASDSGFYLQLTALVDVLLLGRWLERRTARRASGGLAELARLMPETAERICPDGGVETIRVRQLRPGYLLLVRPGDTIAADGEVVEGESEVNENMITGESRPARKEPGSQVLAGSSNGGGHLRVRVTGTGDETALAGIVRLVEDTQQGKLGTLTLADRAAAWLFYIAIAAAIVTAVVWIVARGWDAQIVSRALAVLVTASPYALGLAIPIVAAVTTGLAARRGILIRRLPALEAARRLDVVIFAKTGTLTTGRHTLVGSAVVKGWNENRALALAASAEANSEHVIGRAIREAALAVNLPFEPATEFEPLKGRGVRAQVDDHAICVGGPAMLDQLESQPAPPLVEFAQRAGEQGETVVYLAMDGRPVAAFAMADVIRPESKAAVRRLQRMGIEVAMVTGDSGAAAAAVAQELEIERYFPGVLPENRAEKVAELQKDGRRVAVVGHGIDDAAALARADVGIALGSGTNLAIESAGIVLVGSNPLQVVQVIELSRASHSKAVQNLAWAAAYNIVAIPLAAGVLAPLGLLLAPAAGAFLMSLSTIVVALNAQLIRRLRLSD